MAEAVGVGSNLEVTPTWAIAAVCFVLISISIFIEHLFHLASKFLSKSRRTSLNQALNKIKTELMLLGFITLSLTVSQGRISKICIPRDVGNSFLPCIDKTPHSVFEEETTCKTEGKVALLSKKGVDQLQMLIFVLGLFHVFSSILTLGLGMAKMKKWRNWEEETRTLDYQFTNDPRRFRLTHQTTFARRHLKFWSNHPVLRWPACFIRQFCGSVSKTDYFILRHGFIVAHFAEDSKFDFQKFLKRALDNDFQVIVGMDLWVWIFSVLFIFFNAHVFHDHLWLPFIPLVILLSVGTKLEAVITTMCLESRDSSTVVRGTLLVKPNDNLFWFGKPHMLLCLMHFILFQNSFQMAFFSWSWVGTHQKNSNQLCPSFIHILYINFD
ncbi:hypothetical protein Scep_028157 [Stephania cephalantha]|uniref:MLO-like protein n=1 Tax=Stephania cephalantha TaxID=152367 RepID=A0AAP0EBK6_9MAGN